MGEYKKTSRFVYWTPRILSIIFILFITVFSFDVFDPMNNYTLGQSILAFIMHSIPSIILLAVLLISWKHEIVGGIVFILFGIFFVVRTVMTVLMNLSNAIAPPFLAIAVPVLIIGGPAFFIGILFLIGWNKRKK